MTCFITACSHVLGAERHALDAQSPITSSVDALAEAGFAWHHRASATESAQSLAHAALAQLPESQAQRGLLVHASTLPTSTHSCTEAAAKVRDVRQLMDFTCSKLQSAFGLDDWWPIGLHQQACTGMLGAIRLANGLLASDAELDGAICVAADRFPTAAHYEQSFNLISDGAAAVSILREPAGIGLEVLAHGHLSNGALVSADDDEVLGAFFTGGAHCVSDCLRRAQVNPERVDHLVVQNTHHASWPVFTSITGLHRARVHQASLAQAAHVIAADPIINLEAALPDIANGELVLLFMAGFGMHWQAILLRKHSPKDIPCN